MCLCASNAWLVAQITFRAVTGNPCFCELLCYAIGCWVAHVVDDVYCIGLSFEVCAFIHVLRFCCPPVAYQGGLARSGAAPSVPLRDMSSIQFGGIA